jgi:cell division transport system permease protein
MVLLLLGIVGWLILNASFLSVYVKENIRFAILTKEGVKEPDIKLYQKTLDTYDFVKSTEYISKDKAAEILQEELGEDFVGSLGYTRFQ